MDLSQPCTQEEFAKLVGISQPAVSDLLTRGLLGRGQSAQTWLHAYTAQLREQAAGRGADGELAMRRAQESATRNELLQLKLRKARGEYAEVALIEQVLAAIGARMSSLLEPLPARIKMLQPSLSAEDLKQIDAVITDARNIAASASLSVLTDDGEPDLDDVVQASA
jgi:terminase small subunit / prophage DNA-packing protein